MSPSVPAMDLSTLERLAREAEVVPVTRRVVLQSGARRKDLACLRAGSAFLLESSPRTRGGWEPGGVTLLGFRPRAVWRAWGHRVEMIENGVTKATEEERPLETLVARTQRRPRLDVPGLPSFSGGLVGYVGWGAVRWFEPRVPARLGPDPSFPDAEMMLVDDLVALDEPRGEATLIVNVELARFGSTRAAWEEACGRLDALETALSAEIDAPPDDGAFAVLGSPQDGWGRAGYESAVRSVLDHLHAGDCMQTVLSRRLTVAYEGDPRTLYERLHRGSPVPYHYLLRFEETGQVERRAVLGASPELLVRVHDRTVTVRPIAGTRRRGDSPAEDAALEAELRADPKEQAEHVMLVDLGRNDVGRVARPGSVRVEEREVVERFSHVMHLVSQVSGTLRDGLTAYDAFAAAFPAGTVSGAPKVRALEIIDALEPTPRGPYGGAVGTVSYDGSLVMAIHLRSMALSGRELRLQAGAGIVSDSIPSREFAETEAKLAAVCAALEGP